MIGAAVAALASPALAIALVRPASYRGRPGEPGGQGSRGGGTRHGNRGPDWFMRVS
jgi:hypothetical protein